MSEGSDSGFEVFETPIFRKAFKKLSELEKVLAEDEIDKIISNPNIGEQKKGDLSHLWVYKFDVKKKHVLLGYSWKEAELKIWLLTIGSHENFYQTAKNRRKADKKIIG